MFVIEICKTRHDLNSSFVKQMLQLQQPKAKATGLGIDTVRSVGGGGVWPIFQGKLMCFCIYSSFILYDNPFLFFPSLYNLLKLFLKSRPPVYFNPSFIKFRKFFRPPCLLGPPVYSAPESNLLHSYMVLLRSTQISSILFSETWQLWYRRQYHQN